jgi:purine-nucleoside/S-methyl-5'-thioadenosine phosphorylase / adenosine deaminase
LIEEAAPIERFPALDAIAVCRAAFVKRVPGIEVTDDKAAVLRRLDAAHRNARASLGMAAWPLLTSQQVHGDRVAVIDSGRKKDEHFAGYDGFITNQRQIAIGVHVADCCAVYIVDSKTPAIGLVHSGKKGTELAIAAKAIEAMQQRFGSEPANMVVQLSPCIRPPHYEIDFAAAIREQCHSAGIAQVHDPGICTACDLDSYYSYRAAKGKTGRMLALLGLI